MRAVHAIPYVGGIIDLSPAHPRAAMPSSMKLIDALCAEDHMRSCATASFSARSKAPQERPIWESL